MTVAMAYTVQYMGCFATQLAAPQCCKQQSRHQLFPPEPLGTGRSTALELKGQRNLWAFRLVNKRNCAALKGLIYDDS